MSQKYDDLTLSTSESIERFEAGVSSLAGKKTEFYLNCSGPELYLKTLPRGYRAIVNTIDGEQFELFYTDTGGGDDEGFGLGETGRINRITLYHTDGYAFAIFRCNEGKGVLLHTDNEEDSKTFGTLSESNLWESRRIANSWQEKIDVAKDDLKVMIENELTNRNYVVDELNGQKLIDIVSNPEIFQKCSDFLVLKMIFTDLCDSQMSALYKNKITLYENRLTSEFAARCRALKLDPDLTGEPTVNRPDFTGRLEL